MRYKYLITILSLLLLVSPLSVTQAVGTDNGEQDRLELTEPTAKQISITPDQEPNSFISRWDTTLTNAGSSASNQITLPLLSGGTYDFTVDWGDGQSDIITTWDQPEVTHTYASEGVKDVMIFGTIQGWQFNSAGDVKKIVEISKWGDLNLGNEGAYFAGASNLELTATDVIDLSGTTNLSRTFFQANILGDSGSVDTWDVSSVTNTSHMFYNASTFNQSISSWDVSSVRDMRYMFTHASAFDQDLSNWNVSSVINMSHMFYNASVFNHDIGGWEVSSVTTMASMFGEAVQFNRDLGSWNVSQVTDMSLMFHRTNLSLLHYNSLLMGWSQLDLQHGVSFDARPTQYGTRAENARQYIIATFGWTIVDNGLDPMPVFLFVPEDYVYINGTSGGERAGSIEWEVTDNNPWLYNITRNGTLLSPRPGALDFPNNGHDWSNVDLSGSLGVNLGISHWDFGDHNVTFWAYDQAGQVASDSAIVTIVPYTDTGETNSENTGDPSTDGDSANPGLPFSPLSVLLGTLIMIPVVRRSKS